MDQIYVVKYTTSGSTIDDEIYKHWVSAQCTSK
jgi:hypothetical protein